MAVFKCKMCGGTLEINNETVAVCQYCGTKQTLPKLDDDRKANLYDRANHFRRNNEFDKAMGIYEQILNDDNTDAETYWSLVLCRYGIEYVEDPSSHKRIPTVNRAQFTSIFDDEDYKSALQYADGYQKDIYEQEATAINDIQKGILAISSQEEPFDVFICYKESDNSGRRTPDSVLATELYHELTREGYKVFFSRITLEDKLGSAYEPYIFAALNSAKVMVVLGTKPEYFNAVWVKNEWSRYLALIKNGARKMLIPAYKDMDPYDLPEEFSHLQAQDMSKLGFMQDLIRGIKKIIGAEIPKAAEPKNIPQNMENATGNVNAFLKRGFLALEDGEWAKADDFFEQALNFDAEIAEAYLGKLMAELGVKTKDDLKDLTVPFDDKNNYKKAIRFADTSLDTEVKETIATITKKAEEIRKESLYLKAIDDYKSYSMYRLEHAINVFTSLDGYKDSEEKILLCQKKIEEIKIQLENERITKEKERLERERLAEEERIATEKRNKLIKKISVIVASILAVVVALSVAISSIYEATKKGCEYNVLEDGTIEIISCDVSSADLTIPSEIHGYTVSAIGNCVFENCTSLKSITIPNGVTSIGASAFSSCTSLESITISNSVTTIESFAFKACRALKSITIPNSVTSIGSHAFEYCTSLESITIPNSVTSIGTYAFSGCSSLTSITIPDSVTSIGYGAFEYCSSLTNITIPDSVTSIGNCAFRYCDSLTSITIPNSVTSIGSYAFLGCASLQSVTIPNSVTSIGESAFSACKSLKKVYFHSEAQKQKWAGNFPSGAKLIVQ